MCVIRALLQLRGSSELFIYKRRSSDGRGLSGKPDKAVTAIAATTIVRGAQPCYVAVRLQGMAYSVPLNPAVRGEGAGTSLFPALASLPSSNTCSSIFQAKHDTSSIQ